MLELSAFRVLPVFAERAVVLHQPEDDVLLSGHALSPAELLMYFSLPINIAYLVVKVNSMEFDTIYS